ncbi:UDP-glycosyltransferase 79B6 [Vitis vinifera]|uniref:UDP-glycosyltransferase 79B6 n=1 Tax=Vitis vinifera TaxID=29760 RepID=A0A438BSY4_VITVI|nr:UDP-glycosyltransferase 79B6 [Vitis vinifera]
MAGKKPSNGASGHPVRTSFAGPVPRTTLGVRANRPAILRSCKTTTGAATIEEALPEGFQERVEGGIGSWRVVGAAAVSTEPPISGCFVSHYGYGSMLLAEELKVAVEVEREENGVVFKGKLVRCH